MWRHPFIKGNKSGSLSRERERVGAERRGEGKKVVREKEIRTRHTEPKDHESTEYPYEKQRYIK